MNANAELLVRRNNAVLRGIAHTTPVNVARARNAEAWDVDGKRYVDFAGGIAVLNTGHCHPTVMAAVQAQMQRFTHACFQVMLYEPYVELAERLNAIAPIPGPLKSILLTTGAEATENAVKIARAATGRSAVIAFSGAFHGRTSLAMAMTGKVSPYKRQFGPSTPDIFHVPFPVPHHGVTFEDASRHLDFLFSVDVDPSRVAAIIIEPVQGEGGFHPAPPELMREIRHVCDRYGIVFIADEIQTGFGRTGRMFAMEHYDVAPDMMCLAKSLAGGFPLSAVVGRAAIMDAVEPGGLGGTYAGNPMACAAALAVLDVFEKENLVERSNAIGARVIQRLGILRQRNTLLPIDHIRGLGIVKERGTGTPNPEATKLVIRRAHENGLILLACGTQASTIRILVPLTASNAIVDEGLTILEKALALAEPD